MSYEDILKKYDQEFNQYGSEITPRLNKYIENNRQPFLEFFDKLWKYYVYSAFLIDDKFKKYVDGFDPIFTFFTKSFISLNAIYNLLYNGVPSEASTLLRSIFENLINLEIIIEKDSKFRLKLFDNYKYVEKWLNYKENESYSHTSKEELNKFKIAFPKEKIIKINQDYERVKQDYHPKKPYKWAWYIFKKELNNRNPSIKFFCQKLNRNDDYFRVYSVLSIPAHGSSTVLNLMKVKNSISVAPTFNDHTLRIGAMSILYCSRIIDKTMDYLDLPIKNEIKIYSSTFALDIYEYVKQIK